MLSELGSLVFPNTNACYSLIPGDIQKLDWTLALKNFNEQIEKNNDANSIRPVLNHFLSEKYPLALVCLIALCLSDLLIHSLDKTNGLLVNKDGSLVGRSTAPAVKGFHLARSTFISYSMPSKQLKNIPLNKSSNGFIKVV